MMKRVMINAYQVGLVFKKGAFSRMLKAGTYWLWPSEAMLVYELTKPFTAPCELNILLQDVDVKEALQLVEVRDNEIVLQYENGLLKQVLTSGRYTFW
ncbi:MAG: slipin family protein, partial [Bacteroidota bacterium]|nr:slipin family protein [Bacteroidota bacterium]